ncbi:hypothetical protein [Clavibacter michiganensis]|uniref:hypothetical protein n=1 Tax=Clavibacter michiganensis TaxID=28447 RepID=UPI003EBA318C
MMTILATGAVTAFVAWLSALLTRKNDAAKLKAEEAREARRLAHERSLAEATEKRLLAEASLIRDERNRHEEDVAAEAEAERAHTVSEILLSAYSYAVNWEPDRGDNMDYSEYFSDRWCVDIFELKRQVAKIKTSELRYQLNLLIESVDDSYMRSVRGSTPQVWTRWVLNIGYELATAAARRQRIDEEVTERYTAFFDVFTDVWQTREEEREVGERT